MLSLACHPLLNRSLPHYESQSEVSAKCELTALIYLNAITDVEAVKLYLENNHKR